ncbi:MAG: DUF177 domain-containing protein [Deltaproteobacteria bacterium]|nr:DUF177 domain-containing protein [Deltaproteobacteria bacterium]
MTALTLNIAKLGEEAFSFERDLDDGTLRELLGGGSLELLAGETFAALRLVVTRMDNTVFIRGSMRGRFHVPCSRCLEPAAVTLDEENLALMFLPPAALAVDGEELELDIEDLATYAHDGERIDVGELLREYLLLAIPIAPLCHEACAGIPWSAATEAKGAKEDESVDGGAGGVSVGWKAQLKRLSASLKPEGE